MEQDSYPPSEQWRAEAEERERRQGDLAWGNQETGEGGRTASGIQGEASESSAEAVGEVVEDQGNAWRQSAAGMLGVHALPIRPVLRRGRGLPVKSFHQ